MSRNPIVEFRYDGEKLRGEEIGIAMPREGKSGSTRAIIKCNKIDDSPVRVKRSRVTYQPDKKSPSSPITEEEDEDKIMSLPEYSSRTESGDWKVYDSKDDVDQPESFDDLEPRRKMFDKHSDLKDEFNVSDVQGSKLEGRKIYKLFYAPADF